MCSSRIERTSALRQRLGIMNPDLHCGRALATILQRHIEDPFSADSKDNANSLLPDARCRSDCELLTLFSSFRDCDMAAMADLRHLRRGGALVAVMEGPKVKEQPEKDGFRFRREGREEERVKGRRPTPRGIRRRERSSVDRAHGGRL